MLEFLYSFIFDSLFTQTADLDCLFSSVRSLAVGSGSMMCRVGSVVAPFCVYLADVWIYLPQVLKLAFSSAKFRTHIVFNVKSTDLKSAFQVIYWSFNVFHMAQTAKKINKLPGFNVVS